MFNKKDYINEYVRNNYKTIKLRIRKNNKLVLNKIESLSNINKYLTDLIMKDIREHHVYNFINNETNIDFELSKKNAIVGR